MTHQPRKPRWPAIPLGIGLLLLVSTLWRLPPPQDDQARLDQLHLAVWTLNDQHPSSNYGGWPPEDCERYCALLEQIRAIHEAHDWPALGPNPSERVKRGAAARERPAD